MLTDPDGRPVFFINMHKYSAADFVSRPAKCLRRLIRRAAVREA